MWALSLHLPQFPSTILHFLAARRRSETNGRAAAPGDLRSDGWLGTLVRGPGDLRSGEWQGRETPPQRRSELLAGRMAGAATILSRST